MALYTRTPLHPAALSSVPYGIVLVRVRVRCRSKIEVSRKKLSDYRGENARLDVVLK